MQEFTMHQHLVILFRTAVQFFYSVPLQKVQDHRARLGLGPVLVLNFLYPSIRSGQRPLYRLGSGLELGPVLVYCTDYTPAVDSGSVTLCGPVALYLMQ